MGSRLIYHNWFFSRLLYVCSRLFLAIIGWRVVDEKPDVRKAVLLAAPHTSNWDFPIFLASAGVLRLEARFLGKHTLFKGRFGWFFHWAGGIPVDRTGGNPGAVVDQAVAAFKAQDHLILTIAPEGTRSKVNEWKTGFYRIAHGAGVPIIPAYVDARTKTIGFGKPFEPTGDMTKDINTLREFYANKQGIRAASTEHGQPR